MWLGMIADGLFFGFTLPLLTRATVSLEIKQIGFVLPTGSTNAYLSVHCLKLAIFGINFSFFVGFKARHDFRLLRKLPFTNLSAHVVAIDTQNLRDPQSSQPTLSE